MGVIKAPRCGHLRQRTPSRLIRNGDAHVKVLSGTRTGLLPCCGSTRRLILAPRRGVLE